MGGIIKRGIYTTTGAGAITDAENGLSVINPGPVDFRAVLGNDVGDTDAALLSNREIPNDGFFIAITGPGNVLLNTITDQGDKLQVNGVVLQFVEGDPLNYVVLDSQGLNAKSDIPGITVSTNNTIAGIAFVTTDYALLVNPHILATQNTAGELIFIMDTPHTDPAGGELGLYSVSGHGFIGDSQTRTDVGATWQVYGSMFVEGISGFGRLPAAEAYIAAAAGSNTFAPFLYAAGSLLASLTDGAKEFDGTNEYLTVNGIRYALAKTLTTIELLDFPATGGQSNQDLTIALPGAQLSDIVSLGVPDASVLGDSCYTAWVSAPNIVTVRFNNYSPAVQDPPQGSFRISITQY